MRWGDINNILLYYKKNNGDHTQTITDDIHHKNSTTGHRQMIMDDLRHKNRQQQ